MSNWPSKRCFRDNASNNGIKCLRTNERYECSNSESTNPKEGKLTPRPSLVKLPNIKDTKAILKASRGKKIIQKRIVTLAPDFSTAATNARRP